MWETCLAPGWPQLRSRHVFLPNLPHFDYLSQVAFPRASLVAQRLKCLPAMQETWVQSLGGEDPLKQKMSRSFSGASGKPSFPSTSAGDLRELPMVPLIGEGCCGVGGASQDSAGFGAMEEGLISRALI